MAREFPDAGEHDTFTRAPAGMLLCFGERTPGAPFMVHPVASTVPPELTSETTHVPALELHDTLLTATSAGP